MDEYQQECEIRASCEASENLLWRRQRLLAQRRITQIGSSYGPIHGTNWLHSKKGKGRITPNPDTSGLGVTGGPKLGVLPERLSL